MNELIRLLLANIQIDFQGDLSVDQVRALLREEDSRESRKLLGKIIDDGGIDDMLITLADCLNDHITPGITPTTVNEQLRIYAES